MVEPHTDGRDYGLSPRISRFFPLILAFYGACFYLPYLSGTTTTVLPTFQDESQWFLYTLFINSSFARGFFPLWTPDLASGMPFLAWSHSAALYPTNLIFGLFEFGRAFWMTQCLHGVIYSLGLYWLCLRLGASPVSSLVAVLFAGALNVYGPNGGGFLPNLRTGSWAPAWMLCFYALLVERRLRWLLGFTLITVLMFLGGQVELIGLGWELLGVCSLAGAVMVWRRQGPRALVAPAALFVTAFLLSYLASQVQALPTLELTHFSIRGRGLAFGYFKIWSGWFNLPFWIPYLATGFSLAMLVAAVAGARRSPVLLVVLIGFGFCLMLIHNLFWVMRLMYLIPVARDLLNHARISSYAVVLIGAASALGLDHIANSDRRQAWLRLAGVSGLILTPLLLLFVFTPNGSVFATEQSGVNEAAQIYRMMRLGLLVSLLVYLPLAIVPGRLSRPRLVPALAAAVALIVLALPFIASMPRRPLDPFRFAPEYEIFFRSHPGLYRAQVIFPWDRWETITEPVQAGIFAGVRSADAFITVSLDRYTRLVDAYLPTTFNEQDGFISDLELTRVLKDSTSTDTKARPLINLLGIKYILAEQANLRSPSQYFLAYPDTTLAQSPGVEVLRREAPTRPGGYENLARFVGRAEARLAISEGDELSFRVGMAPQPNWWLATFAGPGGRTRLIAARRADLPVELRASLAVGRDEEGTLAFAALPAGRAPAAPEPAELLDPVISNPKKYWQRLPVAAPFSVFENPGALPAAFMPASVVGLDQDEALPWVRANTDPGRRAVVEDALPPPPAQLRPGEGVKVVGYSPERVVLEATAGQPRLVVLTDTIFPGWRMTVNGRPERIRAADYAFRGVLVGRGKSRAELLYQPVSFRLGLWISLATLAGLTAAAVRRRS